MATASIFHLWSESEAFIWFGFYANTDEVQAVQLCFKWISSFILSKVAQSQANTPLL